LRRIKMLLAVVAAMSMLVVLSAPAMANDWGWNHNRDFDGHKDFDGNDLFLNAFEDFDDEDAEEEFFALDDCQIVSFFEDQAVIVCEA
jgi:hypothetical protein